MAQRIYALVLAAGRASRFGTTKQLAAIDGEAMVARACRLAAAVAGENTLLVTGHDAARVHRAAGRYCRGTLLNDHVDAGLSASIACGVNAVADLADAVLILLADQPAVTPADLDRLLSRYRQTGRIVASQYADIVGPPAVFPRSDFPALTALKGDRGARALLRGNDVDTLPLPAAARDIDDPAALDAFLKKRGQSKFTGGD